MTGHVQVAVIGGGVTGTAILLALARAGLSDCVLFERSELTAGATWHSSGHIAHYTTSSLLTGYAARTRAFVDATLEEVDQDVNLIELGSLRLATSPDAFTLFSRFAETTGGIASAARMVSADEVAAMWPLAGVADTYGALHVAADCRLNPADLTQAYARAARSRGATIRRGVEVTGLAQQPGGRWTLTTNTSETWTADHVVTASGIFARRTLPMLGINLPVSVVSHQYLVTEPVPDIAARRAAGAGPLPILRQPDIGMNIREEGDGFCISLYEQNASTVFPDGPPAQWGMELFPEDFDSIEQGFVSAMERVPCLGEAGIRTSVHGPMPWSPDFAPIIGPVPGMRGLWCAEAMSYGVTWSGAAAEILARWIAEGDPGEDTSAVTPARFGPYATSAWADSRALGTYKGIYGAGETDVSVATSQVHDILESRGSVFEEHDGRALAVHVDNVPIAGPQTAICILPKPMAMCAEGCDVEGALAQGLAAYTPLQGDRAGSGWLVSSRGTALAKISTMRVNENAVELTLDGACPRHSAAELQLRCPSVTFAPLDKEAMIVIGREADKLVIDLMLPKNAPIGHSVPFDRGVGTARRLADLGGFARWSFEHTADAHRAVLQTIMDRLPDAAVIGSQDYADLQISIGEARVGYELNADTTLEGIRVSGQIAGMVGPSALCQVHIRVTEGETLLPDTVLRNKGGAIVGQILSQTSAGPDIAGIAAIATQNHGTDCPTFVHFGETATPAQLSAIANRPMPS